MVLDEDMSTVASAPMPGPDADGRRLRREQNRRTVVEALVSLYEEGRYEPSAAEIAERAGLSARSLFRYFDDTDDLARAAVAHHEARVRPLLAAPVSADDPLDHRLRELVRHRIELWEAIGPSARLARMRAPVVPLLASELRRNRAAQRAQVERHLEPELASLGRRRRAVLAAADVLCSFESYDMLRHDQGLSSREVAAVLTDAIGKLVA
jgi:AcrR family transcriptional regulator